MRFFVPVRVEGSLPAERKMDCYPCNWCMYITCTCTELVMYVLYNQVTEVNVRSAFDSLHSLGREFIYHAFKFLALILATRVSC